MIRLLYWYNLDMNEENFSPYSTCCGRPFGPATPKCNYVDGCMSEYPYEMKACIKKKEPDCTAKAVIPAVTVETIDGITNLANCFVHVVNINTTFYVDDKHRPMITWAGTVERDNYDIANNPLGLRSQFVMGSINGVFTEVYFDRLGLGHIIGTEE